MVTIPRRLSIQDADYDPTLGQRLVVKLDGVDQHGRVEAYDLDASTVTRAKRDASGRLVLEGDEVAMETVSGLLEVTLSD